VIVVTGDPRTMGPAEWDRLPSVNALPPGREVFGFEANGSRWIVGWNGSWLVRHAGIAPRGTLRPSNDR
jgi:hypothetical protein